MLTRPRWLLLLLCAVLAARVALAQSADPAPSNSPAAAAPQLSPKAAYADAMRPLEVTRQNIGNWSDVEIAAMNVAIARGRDACLARKPSAYTGPDLIDLARLCSLGQQWAVVVDAANRYVNAPVPSKPLLADAFVGKIHAELRLKSEDAAFIDSMTLLHTVPYTSEVAESLDETLGYMRFLLTPKALALSAAREEKILAALTSTAPPSTTPPSPTDTLTPHQLYAEGLAFAALQQLAGKPDDAQATTADLDAALPKPFSTDETIRIADARRRYDLLGHPLTEIHPSRSLQATDAKVPPVPANLTITALLLFPDWCAQCVRLAPRLPETVFSVEGHSAYIFALLAQTVPARKPDPALPNAPYNPAFASTLLAGTPTLTVPPALLDRFGASDFPVLLLTDPNGILRVCDPVDGDDLRPGGDLDAAIALVGRTFPPKPPSQAAHPVHAAVQHIR